MPLIPAMSIPSENVETGVVINFVAVFPLLSSQAALNDLSWRFSNAILGCDFFFPFFHLSFFFFFFLLFFYFCTLFLIFLYFPFSFLYFSSSFSPLPSLFFSYTAGASEATTNLRNLFQTQAAIEIQMERSFQCGKSFYFIDVSLKMYLKNVLARCVHLKKDFIYMQKK